MKDTVFAVRLHLDEHCVETSARMRIRELTTQALQGEDGLTESEEAEYELLQRFVDATDFNRLRGERPELDGRKSLWVRVTERESGTFVIDPESV